MRFCIIDMTLVIYPQDIARPHPGTPPSPHMSHNHEGQGSSCCPGPALGYLICDKDGHHCGGDTCADPITVQIGQVYMTPD